MGLGKGGVRETLGIKVAGKNGQSEWHAAQGCIADTWRGPSKTHVPRNKNNSLVQPG